jgi:chromosome segregation ATPase
MNSEEKIAKLEGHIEELRSKQDELYRQLTQAQRDLWQGRIDDLEVQFHLGAMEASDRANELLTQLRHKWAEARSELDGASSTAGEIGATMRTGLENAVRDLRTALLDSKARISS